MMVRTCMLVAHLHIRMCVYMYCMYQMYTYIAAEMSWIQETYDYDRCKEWTEHAKAIQTQVMTIHCTHSQPILSNYRVYIQASNLACVRFVNRVYIPEH